MRSALATKHALCLRTTTKLRLRKFCKQTENPATPHFRPNPYSQQANIANPSLGAQGGGGFGIGTILGVGLLGAAGMYAAVVLLPAVFTALGLEVSEPPEEEATEKRRIYIPVAEIQTVAEPKASAPAMLSSPPPKSTTPNLVSLQRRLEALRKLEKQKNLDGDAVVDVRAEKLHLKGRIKQRILKGSSS
jgi:hypothetical protein